MFKAIWFKDLSLEKQALHIQSLICQGDYCRSALPSSEVFLSDLVDTFCPYFVREITVGVRYPRLKYSYQIYWTHSVPTLSGRLPWEWHTLVWSIPIKFTGHILSPLCQGDYHRSDIPSSEVLLSDLLDTFCPHFVREITIGVTYPHLEYSGQIYWISSADCWYEEQIEDKVWFVILLWGDIWYCYQPYLFC